MRLCQGLEHYLCLNDAGTLCVCVCVKPLMLTGWPLGGVYADLHHPSVLCLAVFTSLWVPKHEAAAGA